MLAIAQHEWPSTLRHPRCKSWPTGQAAIVSQLRVPMEYMNRHAKLQQWMYRVGQPEYRAHRLDKLAGLV